MLCRICSFFSLVARGAAAGDRRGATSPASTQSPSLRVHGARSLWPDPSGGHRPWLPAEGTAGASAPLLLGPHPGFGIRGSDREHAGRGRRRFPELRFCSCVKSRVAKLRRRRVPRLPLGLSSFDPFGRSSVFAPFEMKMACFGAYQTIFFCIPNFSLRCFILFFFFLR